MFGQVKYPKLKKERKENHRTEDHDHEEKSHRQINRFSFRLNKSEPHLTPDPAIIQSKKTPESTRRKKADPGPTHKINRNGSDPQEQSDPDPNFKGKKRMRPNRATI